jgi:hypothetical protein
VIIENGSAVGIVSGGFDRGSTDLYYPLDLPLRILRNLREKQSIPRGTIQSTWMVEKPVDCHARGLSYEDIGKYSPDGSGLLVAKEILPDGPSDTLIEEGDMLRTVNDEIVKAPAHFERLMDGAVGNTLKVQVHRYGTELEFELKVQDLWKLMPYRLLEFAGSVLEDLCYHTAFAFYVPIKGVLLSNVEGSFRLGGSRNKLIYSLNNQPTLDLDAFIEATRVIPSE